VKYFETVSVRKLDELFFRGWIGIMGDYFFLVGKSKKFGGTRFYGWFLDSSTVKPKRDFDRVPFFSDELSMSLVNYNEVHLYHQDNEIWNRQLILEVFEYSSRYV
jgi:hypothetical protein